MTATAMLWTTDAVEVELAKLRMFPHSPRSSFAPQTPRNVDVTLGSATYELQLLAVLVLGVSGC